MNEPSNFCNGQCNNDETSKIKEKYNIEGQTGKTIEYPKYSIHSGINVEETPDKAPSLLNWKTLDINAKHYNNVNHYDVHNLYGLMMAKITRDSLLKLNKNSRPLILTRSTFSGSGITKKIYIY